MDNWTVDPVDVKDPYAPNCSSRAAEGFYVGALYGVVWGAIGRASSADILTPIPAMGALGRLNVPVPPGGVDKRGVAGHIRAFGRGVAGYGLASGSTAVVFGVFVGVVNAGTCACERLRGEKDWVNSMVGGAAAGLSVSLLSRHTRTPRLMAAHAAGAAAITSVVALVTGRQVRM